MMLVSQKWNKKLGNRDPVGIILKQGLSVLSAILVDYFFMHVVCGCLDGSRFISRIGIKVIQAAPNFNYPLVT